MSNLRMLIVATAGMVPDIALAATTRSRTRGVGHG